MAARVVVIGEGGALTEGHGTFINSDGTVVICDMATDGSGSRVIRLGVAIVSVTRPMNNVVVVGHSVGLTAIRI
jgi:hypothetical protein